MLFTTKHIPVLAINRIDTEEPTYLAPSHHPFSMRLIHYSRALLEFFFSPIDPVLSKKNHLLAGRNHAEQGVQKNSIYPGHLSNPQV